MATMNNKRRKKIEVPKAKEHAVGAIPDDVMMEIFLLLPPKSLLRFRAVCRSWAATLSSDEFIRVRTCNARAMPKLLFFTPKAARDSAGVYYCVPLSPPELLLTLDDVRGDSLLPTSQPCLGFTLLYDNLSAAYYICNPATREFTRLPPFADASHSSAGLGFDSRAKECKVVRLLHTEQHMQCEVYTIGASGRAWRPAARGIPFPFIRSVYSAVEHAETTKMPPVFANGCLHWLLGPRHIVDRPGEAILSFCVADETFEWVRAPSFVAAGEHLVQLGGDDFTEEDFQVVWIDELVFVAPPMHLVELDGCLCLVQDLRRHSPEGSTMEIWVLHDYSSGVWSLHSRIDMTGNAARDLLEPRVARVLGSTGNGSPGTGKIVIGTCHQTVHAYDPTSDTIETVLSIDQGTGAGKLRRIKTKRNPEEVSPIQFSLYEESFAPMHRAREEVALSSPRAKAEKEILLRLPARSITRFKLVCKHWRALIESESFIHSHLVFSNTDKEPKIMLVSKGSGSSWFNFHAAPPRGAELNTKVVCTKPCHGLNLISTEAEDYLCNPCTGFQMALLNYSGSQFLSDEQHIDGHRPDNAFSVGDKHIGLGLNLLTQRHVVVKLAYWMHGSHMRLECWYWDGVTLKWNKSDELPPLPVNSMPPAYLDGVLYWMSEP